MRWRWAEANRDSSAVHGPRRFRDSIRRRAETLAQSDGISFDQFVALALAEKVAVLDAGTYLAERAKRGDRRKFDDILARVPDVPPQPGDELTP
jgi:hypothetical protein